MALQDVATLEARAAALGVPVEQIAFDTESSGDETDVRYVYLFISHKTIYLYIHIHIYAYI